MMEYYPVNLDIKGKNCLVVGGGTVGTRKIKTLLSCHARVTTISPLFTDDILKLDNPNLTIHKRDYSSSDIEGMFIVICATDNSQLNLKIADDAKQKNILCNIIDNPSGCNFTLPSVIERGDLMVTVSTGGKSPLFAKKLKGELLEKFGPEYGDLLKVMGKIREKIVTESNNPEGNKELFERIIEGGLLEMIKNRRVGDIDKLLLEILGKGYIFKDLLE